MTDKTEAQRLADQLTSQVEAGGGDLAELEDAAALLLKQEAAIKQLREALAGVLSEMADSNPLMGFDEHDTEAVKSARAALTATEGL